MSRNSGLLLRAFITYVRPLLEYNSIIWSPYLRRDIDLLEQVQRRFTKRLQGLHHYSYEQRLQLLHLQKLETRRRVHDLIWCYKILFGYINVDRDALFDMRVSTTRGHPYKLYKQFTSSTIRASFFTNRVINSWNNLPVSIVDFSSLSSFKRAISNVDLTEL